MEQDILRGEVLRWRTPPKPDTQWHVIVLTDSEGAEHTVTGCALPRPGAEVELRGNWSEHERWGRQFHARSVLRAAPPLSAEGVTRWLCERCPGIGPARAAALLTHYGGNARALWSALAADAAAFEAAGLNAEQAQAAYDALQREGEDGQYQALLHGWGMTQRQIARVKAHWSLDTASTLLSANPYLLADHIDGFGFGRADAVAVKLGIAHNASVRVNAALLHFIEQAAGAGHCFADEVVIRSIAREVRVSVPRLLEAVRELRDGGRLIVEDGARIYLPWLHAAEEALSKDLARRLRYFSAATLTRELESLLTADGGGVQVVEAAQGQQRDPLQARAVDLLADVSAPIGFVTGGPGTGKTTVLRDAIDRLRAQGHSVALAAPTGKAAKRMTAATGQRAHTLHALLGFRSPKSGPDCDTCKASESSFDFGALHGELPAVIIVDEASMVDVTLWAALVDAASGACLRFVGDANQLPPVGAGQPFADALDVAPPAAVVRLRTVYRSKGEWVKAAAPTLLSGTVPPLEPAPGLLRVQVERADCIVDTLSKLMRGELDGEHFRIGTATAAGRMPILTPQRTGSAGVSAINRSLHELLNPAEEGAPCVELEDGNELRMDSWVMITRNDARKRVCNGDTGYVVNVNDAGVAIMIEGAEDAVASYTRAEARAHVQLAYASTVHKSQGSEYPWVVVVCHSAHKRMLTRRLLYTAITRAKEGVVLIGDRDAIEHAAENTREVARCTWLKHRVATWQAKMIATADTENS